MRALSSKRKETPFGDFAASLGWVRARRQMKEPEIAEEFSPAPRRDALDVLDECLRPLVAGNLILALAIALSCCAALAQIQDATNLVRLQFTIGATTIGALAMLLLGLRWQRATAQLQHEAARLRDLATTDTLTGGFNRLQVEKIVAAEMSRASRHERALSILMFDLDNFKAVNDTLGHNAGDEVLRAAWYCASRVVREIDTIARWGGDEFLIVLPETGATEAQAIAMRLQDEMKIQLQRNFGANEVQSRVTLSIGITTCIGCSALSVEKLVSQADARLYEAKRAGKNRIAW